MLTYHCQAASCLFDKTPTVPIISFEVFILLAVVAVLVVFSKSHKVTKTLPKFLVMVLGVFVFEFFTHPMWHNYKMGSWAYVYKDVSWILTIGWSILFYGLVEIIDLVFADVSRMRRFFLYLVAGLAFGLVGEYTVVHLGIRSYAPEVLEVINNHFIPSLGIPWATFYYMPVFMALVIGFYKYWCVVLDRELVIPIRKRRLGRDFLIAFIGVLLFELMIEPMVVNAKLPTWSYIYRDVSILMTGGWVLIIWAAVSVVDKYFIHLNLWKRFFMYIAVISVITTPIEVFLMRYGFRLYGQSAVENFSGLTLPMTSVPIEVILAIPFYLSLVVAFNRYWMYILDNDR